MSEFCLLESPSGDFLAAGGAGLGHVPEAGDAALWRCSGEQLVHVQTGARLAPGPSFEIDGTGYRRIPGPPRLPSACLDELREHGMTVLPNVLSGADADVIRDGFMDAWHRQHPDAGAHDGRMSIMDALAWCAPLARAVTHPVALWLMRRYMATGEIHFAHQPVITTAKPARDLLGTFPEGGWHSDYPYHPGVFEGDRWPADPVYGVQFNICIDAFRADNGATQYLPGSFRLGRWPDDAFNGPTRIGEPPHQDIVQMLAPAGAALIYDARMWHRACYELNVSGRNRLAVLNAVTPAYVPPMLPKGALADTYLAGPVPAQLSAREAREIEALCVGRTAVPPAGAPVFGERRLPPVKPAGRR